MRTRILVEIFGRPMIPRNLTGSEAHEFYFKFLINFLTDYLKKKIIILVIFDLMKNNEQALNETVFETCFIK